eukprot:Tamp_21100.p2 GENE.Tamp_21100~~Tamp_21100.p2  ORF type:complete len:230 (-),score=53.91 Tamp_21100:289-978(-)
MGSDDGAKKAKEMVVGPDGMPDMTGAKPGSFAPMLLGFTFIPLAIGLAIASAIYKYGSTGAYDSNMKTIIEKDMHWVYLAVVVFGRMIVFVNIVPMAYKSKMTGNIRANMYFYKNIGDKAPGNAVVLQDTGDAGAYNRANRSVHHMIENFGAVVAGFGLVGAVYPFPMFVLTCVFAAGRMMHQIGYTTGYGGHAVGFLMSNMIAATTVEGLCLLVALKGLGVALPGVFV